MKTRPPLTPARIMRLLALTPLVALGWIIALIMLYNSAFHRLPLKASEWHLLALAATAVTIYVCHREWEKLISYLELAILYAIVLTLAAILGPNFIRARAPGTLTACKSNLKNLATCAEMYAGDNAEKYPARLHSLTPKYLKVIPQCPSAGADTYSNSYRSASTPDAYTFMCEGEHHRTAGINQPNYPQYSSREGLILP